MGKFLKLFLKNKSNIVVTLLLIVLGVAAIVFLPLLFVLGLKLLGLNVEYGFYSWLGSAIVLSMISTASSSKKG